MKRRNKAGELRMVVVFLRFAARMTQTEFGRASRVDQGDLSRYERGKEEVPEEVLRRMAAAARVPWHMVAHLRRLSAGVLAVMDGRALAPPRDSLESVIRESALLEVASYLIEEAAAETDGLTPEEARREAEEIWAGLERLPVSRYRRLIEFSPRASQSWALAVKLGRESARAVARSGEEALTLAELALSIAERVPGEESWRLRVQEFALARLANARKAANDQAGAKQALARAWELWRRRGSLGTA